MSAPRGKVRIDTSSNYGETTHITSSLASILGFFLTYYNSNSK